MAEVGCSSGLQAPGQAAAWPKPRSFGGRLQQHAAPTNQLTCLAVALLAAPAATVATAATAREGAQAEAAAVKRRQRRFRGRSKKHGQAGTQHGHETPSASRSNGRTSAE